jgi:hypothetical protein
VATPLRSCPNPDKLGYRTRGDALADFVTVHGQVVAHAAYLCRCGRWHIATKRFRRS